MNALVTDAHLRRSLIVIRSLVKRGIDVTAAGEMKYLNSTFYSRYCRKSILYPSPSMHETAFLKAISKIAKEYDVLIPLHERTMVPISKHLDELREIIRVPIPSYETLLLAIDKSKTIQVARNLGIPTPRTHFINDLKEFTSLSKDLQYPVVIKLREEIFTPPPRYAYAFSPKDLLIKYKMMNKKNAHPIIQEFILGRGYGFFTIFNERSEPLTVFCHRRIRELPITGGQSVYCESVFEPQIVKYGLKLLKEIRWYGVAMVEFRLDYRDDKFKLMEVNPRFWGSLPLAIASGMDFPFLLYKMAFGENVKCLVYKSGIKCRFLYDDILALKQALREANNKFQCICDFLKSFFDKNVTYGDISLDDPAPAGYTMAMKLLSVL